MFTDSPSATETSVVSPEPATEISAEPTVPTRVSPGARDVEVQPPATLATVQSPQPALASSSDWVRPTLPQTRPSASMSTSWAPG
jgi:hypothetical protein